jgi:hypothetical protein
VAGGRRGAVAGRRLSVSRLTAIAALAALAPLGLAGPPLLLATATMVVLAAVAWSDTLIGRRILEVT